MATFFLVLGCSFIVGLIAAMISGHFFMSALFSLVFGAQVAFLNYSKICSQGMDCALLLIIPFVFIGAMAGTSLGTAFSHSPSGLGSVDE